MKRRTFFKRLFNSILGLSGLIALDAFWFEKYIIHWTEFDLSNGHEEKIKLVQLSDLHLRGLHYGLTSIAEKVDKLKPDAILFTGDTITRKTRLDLLDEYLNQFDDSVLKIFIYGNKEYSGRIPLDAFRQVIAKHNGVLLINESFGIRKGNRTLHFLGIDDFIGGNADFVHTISTIDDKNTDTIVLNHCPQYSDTIARLNNSFKINIKCILSGHTHGGQITFFGRELYKPGGSGRYLKGWYKTGDIPMYVSKGIGTTILPIRFWARAEASIFYV
ncbi:metallophosphoesterase [Maribacter algicola]|uniref:Metallophosphoesterase n=1 Tax=Maribacter algicola TaxID=2498892 RepID=A0A426RGV5_9FLAO|nr:metallophosphoesterase [Maribacter algicola]RRQ48237.1 metallophosphoesterase [Maribacter algicola]